MVLDEPLEGLVGQERHVAGQDQDGVAVVALGLPGLRDRVTGAEPLALLDDGAHVGVAATRHDVVRVRSDDQHDAVGRGAARHEADRR